MHHLAAPGDGDRAERSFATAVFRPVAWAGMLLALPLLALAVYQCRDLANDDAFITYRYARNLIAGLGFVFNPGEKVLGTSTPLYTLLLAPWARLDGLLPFVSNTIGCLSVGLQAWLVARILAKLGAGPHFAVAAGLFLLGGGIGSYWHVGMETNLLVALMAGSIERLLQGRTTQAAVLVGVAVLCRNDALVLAGLLAAELVVHQKKTWRDLLIPALSFAAILAPWALFACFYFGSPFPNSLAAKMHSLTVGRYLLGGGLQMARSTLAFSQQQSPTSLALSAAETPAEFFWGLVLIGLLGVAIVTSWRRKDAVAIPFLLPVLLLGAYAFIGPPIEHTWHLYPAAAMLFLAVAVGMFRLLAHVVRGKRPNRWLAWTGVFAVAAGSLAYLSTFASASEDDMYFGRRARALGEMGRVIAERVPVNQAISALEIGIVGYHCRNPIVDRAGIVTPGLSYHSSSLGHSMRQAWLLHPTDYLVVIPLEYRMVAGAVDVLKVVDGYGYKPLALVRRSHPVPAEATQAR
jgi:hypothetical protein